MSIQLDYAPDLEQAAIYDFLLQPGPATWDEVLVAPTGFVHAGAANKSLGDIKDQRKIRTSLVYLQVTEPALGGGRQVIANVQARIFAFHIFDVEIKAAFFVSTACPAPIAAAAVNAFDQFTSASGDPEAYFEAAVANVQGAQREWFEVRCTFSIKRDGVIERQEELDAITAFYQGTAKGSISPGPDSGDEDLERSEYLQRRDFRVHRVQTIDSWGYQEKPRDPLHEQDADGRTARDVIAEVSFKEGGALDCHDLKDNDHKVMTLLTFPEFRVIQRQLVLKLGCVRVYIPYPVIQIKWSDLNLYGYYRLPKDLGEIVFGVVEDCFWHAALSGAVIGAVFGNFAAALAAFRGIFTECIKQQLHRLLECLIPGVLLISETRKDWEDL